VKDKRNRRMEDEIVIDVGGYTTQTGCCLWLRETFLSQFSQIPSIFILSFSFSLTPFQYAQTTLNLVLKNSSPCWFCHCYSFFNGPSSQMEVLSFCFCFFTHSFLTHFQTISVFSQRSAWVQSLSHSHACPLQTWCNSVSNSQEQTLSSLCCVLLGLPAEKAWVEDANHSEKGRSSSVVRNQHLERRMKAESCEEGEPTFIQALGVSLRAWMIPLL
jgi:hypothetical protein